MLGSNDFYLSGSDPSERHPQFDLIKLHIERAVQDLFLSSLRSRNDDILHVFHDENQIDVFLKRIIKYWESLEKYEVCKEIVDLSSDLKERWASREAETDSPALLRIREMFFKSD